MKSIIQGPALNSVAFNKQVLLLIDIESLQLEYANPGLETYAGISEKNRNYCFFHDLIHPEDLEAYLEHLNHFKNSGKEKVAEIKIRLKNSDEEWNVFNFKNRIYQSSLNDKENLLIGIGERCDFLSQKEKIKSAHSKDIDSTGNDYLDYLEMMDEGYCVIEMIFDKNNEPVDYLYIETNSAFERQTTLFNVEGRTMKELAPSHEDHWFQIYGEVAVSGKAKRFRHHAKYLGPSWFDLYAFKTGGTSSFRVVIFFRNITKEKKMEDNLIRAREQLKRKVKLRQSELQESKELLQNVFDTSDLGIAVLKIQRDSEGNVEDFKMLRINQIMKQMYGNQDPTGERYRQLSGYGNEFGIFDDLKNSVLTGIPIDKEILFKKQELNNWFRFKAKVQGDILITSIEDITQKKTEAQQLEETLRFKKQLVRASPETILIVNLNTFSVRYINRDIFPEGGVTREMVQGMSLEEILPYIHPRDREKILDLHKRLLKASLDEIVDIEIRLKLDGAVWEWFSVRGKIFHRKNKSWVDEYVLLVRNINKLKITQEALLKAEKLSIQGEIARTFAHELRNPLASIGMATEVLKKKYGLTEKNTGIGKYLDILDRSAKRLNKLINHLLNSSNYSPAVLKKVDLAEVIEEVLHRASDRIYLAGIKLERSYEGPYYIMADRGKLSIALLNIIVNASEATTPDEGIIKIEIKEEKTDFILSVQDNGQGIDPEHKEKLFDAFYTKKDEGIGIGLNSVKNILEEHDAKIKVWSEPEKGSRFSMYFTKAEKD